MRHTILPRQTRMSARHRLVAVGTAVLLTAGTIFTTASTTHAAVITTPDAMRVAQALGSPSVPITGAEWVTRPQEGTPTAEADSLAAGFPTVGSHYAILSSGDAGLALTPGSEPSADNFGPSVEGHGNNDYDAVILKVDIDAPDPLNCLHFDFKFLSTEYPVYVGSSYNDAFIAEVDHDDWTTSTSALSPISAPHNFAFDQDGRPVTINTSGYEAMKPEYSAGTGFGSPHAATPVLEASTLIDPGPHSVYFAIFDQGDHVYDSAAFIDDLALSYAKVPKDCPTGSVVKKVNIDLTPDHAVNKTGATHTVDALVTSPETLAPRPGAHILFQVTGANPTSGFGVTGADGRTSFTYHGTHPGKDIITACYDPTDALPCPADEVLSQVSVTKMWEAAPPHLTLTPATATNSVGASHTVTAHLTAYDGAPVSGGHMLFTVTGANDLTGKAITNAAGDATFTYTGHGDGTDQITACYDANGNGVCDPDEVTATATKTWVVPSPSLSLSPRLTTEPVGELHEEVATLTDPGMPVENGKILFRVTGANHASGEAFTDAKGQAAFAYIGRHAGDDTTTACFDANTTDTCDFAEARITAKAKTTWVRPTIQLSPATGINMVGGDHTVTARLTDPSGAPDADGLVHFTVTGANHASGEEATGPDGTASFTYTGRHLGQDTITACLDVNENRTCEPDEPTVTARKLWVTEVPVTG